MPLVESFTIVGVFATPYFAAASQTGFKKPVRISQGLACRRNNIGFAPFENQFWKFDC